uniref:Secreted protein n=1 Tax=Glossina pallidipes TaxID=7398 RepID=A0A1B0ACW6_GLOPL
MSLKKFRLNCVLLLLSVTLLLLLFGKCTRRPERRLFVCSLDCLPACLRTIHSTILYSTTQTTFKMLNTGSKLIFAYLAANTAYKEGHTTNVLSKINIFTNIIKI